MSCEERSGSCRDVAEDLNVVVGIPLSEKSRSPLGASIAILTGPYKNRHDLG